MKISELKQPYRRMAEYCKVNIDADDVDEAFTWGITNHDFWEAIDNGGHPPITEEIKKHFPPDFDFSGEEVKTNPVMQFLHAETQKRIYTQLAKEGKFDELPDTCEFSEAVELDVSDCNELFKTLEVVGKFKGKFVEKENISCVGYALWNFAKLPTKKIDFSQFKAGDVVEVELSNEEKRIGWFDFTNNNHLYIRILQRKGNQICNGGNCAGTKIINKEKIKSITKIK